MESNIVQNALNEMHEQWLHDTQTLAQFETEANKLLHDEEHLHSIQTERSRIENQTTFSGLFNHMPEWADGANLRSYENHVATDENSLSGIEHSLEAEDPGCEFIANAVSGLLVANLGQGDANLISAIGSNAAEVAKYLTDLFNALQENVQINEQRELLNNNSLKQSSSAMESEALQMMHDESLEQTTLSQLMNTMMSDYAGFNNQYNSAEEDHAQYDFLQSTFSRSDQQAESADDRIMANAQFMENAILSTMKTIAPAIAAASEASFQQIQFLLQKIVRELQHILNDSNLSLQAKQGKILGLVMFALGLFGVLTQTQENGKTNNESQMAQANIAATEMNMANQQANQKIVAEEAHNEQAMKTLQLVSTIVLGVVGALMGGIGTAVLMAALTVLEATGEMNKATQDLATAIGNAIHNQDTGQILADITIAAAEMALAGGGGFALDAMISKVAIKATVASAVEAAKNAAQGAIEATTNAAVAQATPEVLDSIDRITIETTVRRAATKAAEIAAQKVAEQFYNQPMYQLLPLLGKQLVSSASCRAIDLGTTFSQAIAAATEKAASDAAITAASSEKTLDLAAQVANPNPGFTRNALQSQSSSIRTAKINEIAAVSAKKSIAEATGENPDSKFTKVKEALASTPGRMVLAGLFGVTSTNLITNIIQAEAAAHHETADQGLITAMDVIQAMLQAIAMMGALSSGVNLLTAPVGLMRISMATQGAAQATSGVASLQAAEMQEVQAEATQRLQMTNAIADLLHSTLEEMQQQIKNSQQAFFAQQKILNNTMNQMATHLYDGVNAGNQVLINLAG